jgi:nucleosome assembly protein 1-like 1
VSTDFHPRQRFHGLRAIIPLLSSFSQIIPRAIDYFTGKALRYEVDDEDYSDDEDEDEDEEDELDDDDDEEEEEEEEIPRRTAKRGGAGAKKAKAVGAGATGNEAGECKQQ